MFLSENISSRDSSGEIYPTSFCEFPHNRDERIAHEFRAGLLQAALGASILQTQGDPTTAPWQTAFLGNRIWRGLVAFEP
jgi:hypothetical protein